MAKFEPKGADLYIDDRKVIKAYESFSGWYWFATEESHKQDSVINGVVYKDDTIFFGLKYKNLLFPLRGEWPLPAINLPF